jgi:hypothetical protein
MVPSPAPPNRGWRGLYFLNRPSNLCQQASLQLTLKNNAGHNGPLASFKGVDASLRLGPQAPLPAGSHHFQRIFEYSIASSVLSLRVELPVRM